MKKLYTLLLAAVFAVVGCSSNDDRSDMGESTTAGANNETQTPNGVDIEKFNGTWVACREDSTAESTRITFIFDGVRAAFVEEFISPTGCGNEPDFTEVRVGELLFELPVVDEALGFDAYPITFIDSDPEVSDTKDLIYTDTNLIFMGRARNRSSEDEFPTALDDSLGFLFMGPPDFSKLDL